MEVPSALLPIKYSKDILPPSNTEVVDPSDEETAAIIKSSSSGASDESQVTLYSPSKSSKVPSHSKKPVLIQQDRLDFIVSKLELSQKKSEELASFLKQQNLLAAGTKVTVYRKRQSVFQAFFTMNEEKTFTYCHDIGMLMNSMEIQYIADDWRLFIDSSMRSLKAVLLHKLNKKPSVPIAYSTDTKETYEKMQLILEKVKYVEHNWRLCCDLKVVAMLCGMQQGYTKYMCFLCKWDSRSKTNQYQNHSWENREKHEMLKYNVMRENLVPFSKILMPYLHVKLGVVKSFIKTIVNNKDNPDHGQTIFKRLKEMFHISDEKIKQGKYFYAF